MLKKNLGRLKSVRLFYKRASFKLIVTLTFCFSVFVVAEEKKMSVKSYIEKAERAVRIQNFVHALEQYQIAAELGDAEAQYQTFSLLTLKSEAASNKLAGKNLAQQWLRKSAAQNHPAAMYHLALEKEKLMEEGAEALMAHSAELGFRAAKNHLKRMRRKPSAGKISDTRAGAKSNTLFNTETFDLWFGAARLGDIDTLKALNQQGVHIDQQDESGRTALFVAIEFDQEQVVSWLLNINATEKVNINHADHFGSTPLFIALSHNNERIFSILVNAQSDLQHILKNGDNLWHQVISQNKLAFSNILLKHKVDINHINKAGWAPLDLAHYHEHDTLAEKMKSAGAKHGRAWITQKNTISNTTVEQYYSARGSIPIDAVELSKVISSGNDKLFASLIQDHPELVNSPLEDDSTLLMHASAEQQDLMVKSLLDGNAKTNATDKKGLTALHIASRHGLVSIANLLFTAGADPNKTCEKGMDALDWSIENNQDDTFVKMFLIFKDKLSKPLQRYLIAAAKNNMTSVVKFLAATVEFDIADQLGRSSSWYAAYHQNIEMLYSLGKLIDKNKTDKYGKSAFFVAVEKDCYACAEILANTENIHAKSQSGDTPLIVAAANGNTKMVEWLLTKDVDIDVRNALGNTALIAASESQNLAVVQRLVESKASIGRKNKLGFSALDIAERKNKEIFEYLKERSILGVL